MRVQTGRATPKWEPKWEAFLNEKALCLSKKGWDTKMGTKMRRVYQREGALSDQEGA
jgi:hypothetical protein